MADDLVAREFAEQVLTWRHPLSTETVALARAYLAVVAERDKLAASVPIVLGAANAKLKEAASCAAIDEQQRLGLVSDNATLAAQLAAMTAERDYWDETAHVCVEENTALRAQLAASERIKRSFLRP